MALTEEELVPTEGHPLERADIEKILPHRDPFLWVDRVLEHDLGKHVVAELYIDPAWPHFKGHYPGHPVMPGVLMLEALAQTSGIALMAAPESQGKLGYLVKVDNAKFRQQVVPGNMLRLESWVLKNNGRTARAHVEASVDGTVCVEADQMYVVR